MNSMTSKRLEIHQELEELGEAELEQVEALIKTLLAKVGKHMRKPVPPSERGQRMKAILEEGTKRGLFKKSPDPAAWQCEIRQDPAITGQRINPVAGQQYYPLCVSREIRGFM